MTDPGSIPGWLGAIVVLSVGLFGGGTIGAIVNAFINRRSGDRSASTAEFHEITSAWPALLEEQRRAQVAEEKRHQDEVDRLTIDWQRKLDEVKDRLEQCEEGRAEMREVIAMLSAGFDDGDGQ